MNELINQLKQYAELRIELFRLSASETAIKAASSTAVQVILGALLVSSILMAEIALGLFIGMHYGNWSIGFLWLAGLNFVLFLLALLLKKPIIKSIQDGLSKFVK